jgi:hypothetical protein
MKSMMLVNELLAPVFLIFYFTFYDSPTNTGLAAVHARMINMRTGLDHILHRAVTIIHTFRGFLHVIWVADGY